mmetsp:Transcript_10807/g.25591  ORF Transcript_10807/g.25591 Transcript_10807/m.25591 type:complete len:293 (+) Transcript_10807:385-1263(+)
MSQSKCKTSADKSSSDAFSLVVDVGPTYDGKCSGAAKEEPDFQFVQNFHKSVRTSNPNPGHRQQQQQVFSMAFDHPLKFAIDIGEGNSDDSDVIVAMGEESKSWFKIAHVDKFLILTNLKGEPFLMIKEGPFDSRGGLSMDLYRYSPLALAAKNADHVHPPEQKLARVRRKYYKKERKFRFRKSKYVLCIGHYVEILDPYDTQYPLVRCRGYWPNMMHLSTPDDEDDDLKKNVGKKPTEPASIEVATIKKQSFRSNKWLMTVAAEQDVVLLLGIACACELLERKANEQDVCC